MGVNLDYKDTYADATGGNIRYPSNALASIAGWAYVWTIDVDYVNDLAVNNAVQVKIHGHWQAWDEHAHSEETLEAARPDPESSDAEMGAWDEAY